jgi:poly(A) polymerase
MKLELVDTLTLAHPFVRGFEQVAYCRSDEEIRLVAQGEMTSAIAEQKAEDIEGIEGARPVYSTTFYVGLGIEARQRAWISKCWDQTYCSWFLPY